MSIAKLFYSYIKNNIIVDNVNNKLLFSEDCSQAKLHALIPYKSIKEIKKISSDVGGPVISVYVFDDDSSVLIQTAPFDIYPGKDCGEFIATGVRLKSTVRYSSPSGKLVGVYDKKSLWGDGFFLSEPEEKIGEFISKDEFLAM